MARIKLKNILSKKKEAFVLIENLLNAVDPSIRVEDNEGKYLLGSIEKSEEFWYPIEFEDEVLGRVIGGEKADDVAKLLTHLANKEDEKKTLGSEVLSLYREINLIYNFSEKLAAALDINNVAEMALEEAHQLIQATGGSVLLINDKDQTLETIASFGQTMQSQTNMKVGEGIIGNIAASGNAEIINDITADERYTKANNSVSSLICAPLKVKQKVLGIMALVNETTVVYTAGELKLLVTLALQTASAIESAMLHKKTVQEAKQREREKARIALLEAENKRKTEELEEARKLQLSMLPKVIPKLTNIEIAVHMKTATEVGGDYYDFHAGEDGALTAVIGDATGHGLKAGTMVTAAKSLFSALGQNPDIDAIFGQMNESIKAMKLQLLAMCVTMLKIKDGKMRLSSAGIPPVLVYRSSSQKLEEIDVHGLPLGAMKGSYYHEEEVNLEPGDTVLLMSDGFPELMNDEEEMLDYARAYKAFKEAAAKSPKEIISHLVETAKDWANGRPQDDDITFVVLKVKETL